jgi:hypothetical protein
MAWMPEPGRLMILVSSLFSCLAVCTTLWTTRMQRRSESTEADWRTDWNSSVSVPSDERQNHRPDADFSLTRSYLPCETRRPAAAPTRPATRPWDRSALRAERVASWPEERRR